ncbi:hypothetical protein BSKO_05694 [Bryopsis sp. KO-2023]|nr:hypothetical protein BSKO_05694 [Bryopsis sp. KO-2023]
MSNHVNEELSLEMDVHLVSRCFVKQYYWILNERTHLLHQFYGSGSSVVMSESLGPGVKPYQVSATSTGEIYNLLNHMFKDMTVTLTELLPQRSMGGSVMVMVTGRMSQEMWTEERCFTQVFLLARQESGFYIRTDTLQVHNPSETKQMLKGLKLKPPVDEDCTEEKEVEEESPVIESAPEQEQPVPEVIIEEEVVEVVEPPLAPVPETAPVQLDSDVTAPIADPVPMPIRQMTEAAPIVEHEEVEVPCQSDAAAKISAPPPPKVEVSPARNSGAKKSFLEAALSGAKKPVPPKPVMERSNPKAAAPSGEGVEKQALEGEISQTGSGRRSGGGSNQSATTTGTDAEGKAQRQRVPRGRRNSSNKPGVEEGKVEGNGGRGGGRGTRGRGAGQGRGGPGRGPRMPKNPNPEAQGEGERERGQGQGQAKNDDKSQRTVFVGQLPFGLKTETIHSAFCTFGPLDGGMDSISVKSGPNHAFAFVVFEEAASAKKALEGKVRLDGEELAIKPYAPRERSAMKDRAGPGGGRRGGYQGRGGGNGGRYGTPSGNGNGAVGTAPRSEFPPSKYGPGQGGRDGGAGGNSFAGKEAGGRDFSQSGPRDHQGQMRRGGGGGGASRNAEMGVRRGGGQYGNGGRGPGAQRLVHAGV